MREEMLFHQELWEEGEILTYQEALFIIKETETYIQKKKKIWKQATLSIGALLGILEEGSFTRDFERQ